MLQIRKCSFRDCYDKWPGPHWNCLTSHNVVVNNSRCFVHIASCCLTKSCSGTLNCWLLMTSSNNCIWWLVCNLITFSMDETHHCTVRNLISRTSTPQLFLIYFLLLFKLIVKSYIFFEFLSRNTGEDNNFSLIYLHFHL